MDGVTESIANAGKFSIGLIRDIGSGMNESSPVTIMFPNASSKDVLPDAIDAIFITYLYDLSTGAKSNCPPELQEFIEESKK